MISIFSGLMLPSFLNWIRTEKVNSYTRELREYFRVVRLDARRWGSICNINTKSISYNSVPNDKNYYGYDVSCSGGSRTINSLAPAINNSIFQVTNLDFRITPNGRISSDGAVVIVIGSRYFNAGAKLLNCLVIKSPTGHIVKGKFSDKEWISGKMPVSQIDKNNILTPNKCEAS
jgi:type II secretory pathway pseudopilin PulG